MLQSSRLLVLILAGLATPATLVAAVPLPDAAFNAMDVIAMGYNTAKFVAGIDAGYGPGVIKLPYIDGAALRGHSDVFVQVQQLP